MSRRLAPVLILAVVVLVGAYLLVFDRADKQASIPADSRALAAQGAQLYAQTCAACHGANLQGQADWRQPLPDGGLRAPPHNADGHTFHHPDDLLFAITKLGGQSVAPPGFKSNMPAFGELLSDREIQAVLAFIKSSWPADIQVAQQRMSRAAARQ